MNEPPVIAALFGGVPIDPGTQVKNITERIPATHLDLDCILSVVVATGDRTLHFEAFANWRSAIWKRM